MYRYFENHLGTSNKFWEITVDGGTTIAKWGRIGTNGQSKTKTFATHYRAADDAVKMCQSKLNKGYLEVINGKMQMTGNASPPPPQTIKPMTMPPPTPPPPVVAVVAKGGGVRIVRFDD